MKAYVAHVVTGLSLSLFLPSLALALTKADIEGKKICWGKDWKSFTEADRLYAARPPFSIIDSGKDDNSSN